MKNKKVWTGLSSVFAVLLCISIIGTQCALYYAGTVNGLLHTSTSKLVEVEGDGGTVISYPSAYGELTGENLKAMLSDSYEQAISEAEEGMVLLKNQNNALPLGASERSVTLFGHAVAQPLYRNSSAGSVAYNGPEGVDLYKALTDAGFKINDTLYTAYQNSGTARAPGYDATGAAANWSLGEEDISFYTDELRASWSNNYNDIAIVMLAREGGEGNELLIEDPEGISQLALHQAEKDLLQMINDSGRFGKIIVLLNSGNAMEVDWLDEYNVDACIWVGCPGQKGFVGLANILTGAANPSGHITSTYATSSVSAPAVVNNSFNNQTWSNLDEVLSTVTDLPKYASYYTVQAEGIYVGYKYYETRYEDTVLGRFNADSTAGSTTGTMWNYNDEVIYPFGYGLSYTTFSQTIDHVEVGEDTIQVKVTVTNTGNMAGKSVVQIYAQTPYGTYEQQNLVEKSAIQLLDFGKTALLQPGQSETLTIECEKYLLASYDYVNAKGYIMSEGDYYISIGDDAHDALNNVLAAKGAQGMVDLNGNTVSGEVEKTFQWSESFDNTKYKLSSATGTVVTNQFGDCDLNYWVKDAVTYLSRSDWEGTYPVEPIRVAATPEMIEMLGSNYYTKSEDTPPLSSYTQGNNQGITLAAMWGVGYDDALWETFLDQMTITEMASLMPDMFGNAEVISIGKPTTTVGDGPDGIGGMAAYDVNKYGFEAMSTCYTGETTLAATFNKELVANRGMFMAEEATFMGLKELWSPGGNLHRTPFGGRNFEYYSEDANLNYIMGYIEAVQLESKGVASGMKHCALNDQENNREGVCCFFNEQTFRESSLRGFEGAIVKADARSVMQGFNRLGLVGCYLSSALNRNILRAEWGLDGIIITDACIGLTEGYKSHYVDGLAAGTDTFCLDLANTSSAVIEKYIIDNNDGYLLGELRRAVKNILYVSANSPAMNGYNTNSTVVQVTPFWIPTLYGVIIVFSVLTVLSLVALTRAKVSENKQKQNPEVTK